LRTMQTCSSKLRNSARKGEGLGLALELVTRPDKTLNPDWLQGARQRIDIATKTRYSNPRLTLDILLSLFTELLERLENENKTI
jgi:hypothetical protein